MDDRRGDCQTQQQNHKQAEDEESGLFTGLFGRLSDAKGFDESVGEEIEQRHRTILLIASDDTSLRLISRLVCECAPGGLD